MGVTPARVHDDRQLELVDDCPSLGFVDTGLTPGQTYGYRIVVRDSDNHVVNGADAGPSRCRRLCRTNAYANRVRADGAAHLLAAERARAGGDRPCHVGSPTEPGTA